MQIGSRNIHLILIIAGIIIIFTDIMQMMERSSIWNYLSMICGVLMISFGLYGLKRLNVF